MKNFHESDRYFYNLTPDSVIIDGGCYEGNFSLEISRKYACRILAFEPIALMANVAAARLIAYPKVNVYNLGIGGHSRAATFYHKGDSTGMNSEGCTHEEVKIHDIVEVLDEFGLSSVDLLKLNIEGMEYEVLERILDAGLAPRFKNLQVQPHAFPGAEARWAAIKDRLSATHELEYDAPWCWSGWKLK